MVAKAAQLTVYSFTAIGACHCESSFENRCTLIKGAFFCSSLWASSGAKHSVAFVQRNPMAHEIAFPLADDHIWKCASDCASLVPRNCTTFVWQMNSKTVPLDKKCHKCMAKYWWLRCLTSGRTAKSCFQMKMMTRSKKLIAIDRHPRYSFCRTVPRCHFDCQRTGLCLSKLTAQPVIFDLESARGDRRNHTEKPTAGLRWTRHGTSLSLVR